jgi:hypothetical protein
LSRSRRAGDRQDQEGGGTLSIEMFRKDGETADEWEARINALEPPPGTDVLGNSSFYNRRWDALEDLQRERDQGSSSELTARPLYPSAALARVPTPFDEVKEPSATPDRRRAGAVHSVGGEWDAGGLTSPLTGARHTL